MSVGTYLPSQEIREMAAVEFTIRIEEHRSRFVNGSWESLPVVSFDLSDAEQAKAANDRIAKREEQGFTLGKDVWYGHVENAFAAVTGYNGKGARVGFYYIRIDSPEIPEVSGEVDPFEGPSHPYLSNGSRESKANGNIAEAVVAGDRNVRAKKGYRLPSVRGHVANLQATPQDTAAAVVQTQEQAPSGSQVSGLLVGYFTVEQANGKRRTYRISENDSPTFFDGEGLCIGLLSGPDNEADYTSIGISKADGKLVFWKKFADSHEEFRTDVLTIAGDPVSAGERWAVESSRCWCCKRTLTVPASVHRGLGPICAEKLGL
jgi:hypothetical protein